MFEKAAVKSAIALLVLFSLMLAGCTKDAPKPERSNPAMLQWLPIIKQSGKLVIATTENYPFEYTDEETGELIGYDVDLAQAIADEIGVDIEWEKMPFAELLNALQLGKADMVIASMYITEERERAVDMSDKYLDSGMAIVKRMGDHSVRSLNDLTGKTIGVKTQATSEREAEALIAQGTKIKIRSYASVAECMEALRSGEVNIIFNDYLKQVSYNQHYPEAHLELVGGAFTQEGFGIAVVKGQTELLKVVNQVIHRLQENGDADVLYSKWLQ
ncbi:transporter substrate-binding domain-containing protein [Paenibacillus algorifonticola]|uniref:substrate-binding periplasmic protein n=1 Tax=Paenibacillus algorifonticola TaxID=684063 RepID=UPI003D282ABE